MILPAAAECYHEALKSTERKLIANVMLQALEDLHRPHVKWSRTNILTGERIHIYIDGRLTEPFDFRDAIRWFESDDESPYTFVFICRILDLDPIQVRKRVDEIIRTNAKCKRP